MDNVLESKRSRTSTKEHRKEHGKLGTKEWESFHAHASRDGLELTLELIKCGSLQAVRNPELPPQSTMKYPYDQIVRRVRNIESLNEVHGETDRKQVEQDCIEDDADKTFDQQHAEAFQQWEKEGVPQSGVKVVMKDAADENAE